MMPTHLLNLVGFHRRDNSNEQTHVKFRFRDLVQSENQE